MKPIDTAEFLSEIPSCARCGTTHHSPRRCGVCSADGCRECIGRCRDCAEWVCADCADTDPYECRSVLCLDCAAMEASALEDERAASLQPDRAHD